ncbi:MAG TPA: valine--tRNA ligase [Spirochaetia bacterium]|nr:valine--tRNA ligase [Spirochaetia bacterium]
MSDSAMSKAYDPKSFEERVYSEWSSSGVFAPRMDGSGTFVVVIPPPNVTGVLHMGHGLNNILQDILIRYYRMKGRKTLWVPGTDHAGIATQNVVERRLRERGLSKLDLGRERFVEETWKVTNEHHETIVRQLKKIGASCDWGRERFTLDEGLSRAVREVFVTLYERGLIYRGNYLVNWCHSCGTALSDDEVEHQEVRGAMYHFRYPLVGGGSIEIATTRPETMLGDTAVAVHPEDERYRAIVGREVELPLAGRRIPVIADAYVDREFGTGAVKVTPAHDPNDWEIGIRHELERINILKEDGRLSDAVPKKYRGMSVSDARKAVVEDLKAEGFFVREEAHTHQVGHCYRCGTIIEPFVSDQWFVRMRGMADKALAAWQKGEIRFYPKRWENTYTSWLANIRDWCISRQLWWGHRIPVWYCDECGEMIVSRTDPEVCTACGGTLHQDEDVLDTWFSSWLWPFSTLGWPESTEDLREFFPTSALVTAYDIIFFWVSRMIMAGLEFMGQVPFRDIYITGLVRDIQGRKMSKSLGNGMDPLEIVDEYGADSLKFTFAFLSVPGQDVLVDKESFKLGSKFANKIWNATRFLLMNMEGRQILRQDEISLTEVDRWVLHRLDVTVESIDRAIETYRMNDAAQAAYEFFWNDFCDWYIEAAKLSLYGDSDREKDRIATMLISLLEESMRLLHPFLSFITEEIYGRLPGVEGMVASAPYPEARGDRRSPESAARFATLQELVRGIRTLRSELTVPPERKIRVHVLTDVGFAHAQFLSEHLELIRLFVGAERVEISSERHGSDGAIPVAGNGFEALVYVRDVIDVPTEIRRLEKESGKLVGLIEATKRKLGNASFLQNAPEDIVAKERGKLEEFEIRQRKLSGYVRELSRT